MSSKFVELRPTDRPVDTENPQLNPVLMQLKKLIEQSNRINVPCIISVSEMCEELKALGRRRIEILVRMKATPEKYRLFIKKFTAIAMVSESFPDPSFIVTYRVHPGRLAMPSRDAIITLANEFGWTIGNDMSIYHPQFPTLSTRHR